MFSKNQIDALLGFKDKTLVHMANEVGDCVEAKKDIFIDFGEGAEEIDDVLYDDYNKKATFFYKFGSDRRSITLWESDNPTFSFNATFGCYQMAPIRQKREVKEKAPIKKGYFGREFLKGGIFRFYDKHGDLQVFCSTPETKLRVIKLGDETQLHLEHTRKMTLD